jgi:hypothetical protein
MRLRSDAVRRPNNRIEVALVQHVQGGYRLPDGLPEGSIAKLSDFDHGWILF